MSVLLPPELVWALGLIGLPFPDTDEDKMRIAAQGWTDAMTSVLAIADNGDASALNVNYSVQGVSTEAFNAYWDKWTGGDDSYLGEMAAQAQQLASLLLDGAMDVEATKIAIAVQLAILLIQLLVAAALAAETWGASLAEWPVAVALTQDTVGGLLLRLALAALAAALPSAISQGIQVLDGTRAPDQFNWGQVAVAAGSGALMAGLMEGAYSLADRSGADWFTGSSPGQRFTRIGFGALAGSGSGAVAGEATYWANRLLDPQAVGGQTPLTALESGALNGLGYSLLFSGLRESVNALTTSDTATAVPVDLTTNAPETGSQSPSPPVTGPADPVTSEPVTSEPAAPTAPVAKDPGLFSWSDFSPDALDPDSPPSAAEQAETPGTGADAPLGKDDQTAYSILSRAGFSPEKIASSLPPAPTGQTDAPGLDVNAPPSTHDQISTHDQNAYSILSRAGFSPGTFDSGPGPHDIGLTGTGSGQPGGGVPPLSSGPSPTSTDMSSSGTSVYGQANGGGELDRPQPITNQVSPFAENPFENASLQNTQQLQHGNVAVAQPPQPVQPDAQGQQAPAGTTLLPAPAETATTGGVLGGAGIATPPPAAAPITGMPTTGVPGTPGDTPLIAALPPASLQPAFPEIDPPLAPTDPVTWTSLPTTASVTAANGPFKGAPAPDALGPTAGGPTGSAAPGTPPAQATPTTQSNPVTETTRIPNTLPNITVSPGEPTVTDPPLVHTAVGAAPLATASPTIAEPMAEPAVPALSGATAMARLLGSAGSTGSAGSSVAGIHLAPPHTPIVGTGATGQAATPASHAGRTNPPGGTVPAPGNPSATLAGPPVGASRGGDTRPLGTPHASGVQPASSSGPVRHSPEAVAPGHAARPVLPDEVPHLFPPDFTPQRPAELVQLPPEFTALPREFTEPPAEFTVGLPIEIPLYGQAAPWTPPGPGGPAQASGSELPPAYLPTGIPPDAVPEFPAGLPPEFTPRQPPELFRPPPEFSRLPGEFFELPPEFVPLEQLLRAPRTPPAGRNEAPRPPTVFAPEAEPRSVVTGTDQEGDTAFVAIPDPESDPDDPEYEVWDPSGTIELGIGRLDETGFLSPVSGTTEHAPTPLGFTPAGQRESSLFKPIDIRGGTLHTYFPSGAEEYVPIRENGALGENGEPLFGKDFPHGVRVVPSDAGTIHLSGSESDSEAERFGTSVSVTNLVRLFDWNGNPIEAVGETASPLRFALERAMPGGVMPSEEVLPVGTTIGVNAAGDVTRAIVPESETTTTYFARRRRDGVLQQVGTRLTDPDDPGRPIDITMDGEVVSPTGPIIPTGPIVDSHPPGHHHPVPALGDPPDTKRPLSHLTDQFRLLLDEAPDDLATALADLVTQMVAQMVTPREGLDETSDTRNLARLVDDIQVWAGELVTRPGQADVEAALRSALDRLDVTGTGTGTTNPGTTATGTTDPGTRATAPRSRGTAAAPTQQAPPTWQAPLPPSWEVPLARRDIRNQVNEPGDEQGRLPPQAPQPLQGSGKPLMALVTMPKGAVPLLALVDGETTVVYRHGPTRYISEIKDRAGNLTGWEYSPDIPTGLPRHLTRALDADRPDQRTALLAKMRAGGAETVYVSEGTNLIEGYHVRPGGVDEYRRIVRNALGGFQEVTYSALDAFEVTLPRDARATAFTDLVSRQPDFETLRRIPESIPQDWVKLTDPARGRVIGHRDPQGFVYVKEEKPGRVTWKIYGDLPAEFATTTISEEPQAGVATHASAFARDGAPLHPHSSLVVSRHPRHAGTVVALQRENGTYDVLVHDAVSGRVVKTVHHRKLPEEERFSAVEKRPGPLWEPLYDLATGELRGYESFGARLGGDRVFGRHVHIPITSGGEVTGFRSKPAKRASAAEPQELAGAVHNVPATPWPDEAVGVDAVTGRPEVFWDGKNTRVVAYDDRTGFAFGASPGRRPTRGLVWTPGRAWIAMTDGTGEVRLYTSVVRQRDGSITTRYLTPVFGADGRTITDFDVSPTLPVSTTALTSVAGTGDTAWERPDGWVPLLDPTTGGLVAHFDGESYHVPELRPSRQAVQQKVYRTLPPELLAAAQPQPGAGTAGTPSQVAAFSHGDPAAWAARTPVERRLIAAVRHEGRYPSREFKGLFGWQLRRIPIGWDRPETALGAFRTLTRLILNTPGRFAGTTHASFWDTPAGRFERWAADHSVSWLRPLVQENIENPYWRFVADLPRQLITFGSGYGRNYGAMAVTSWSIVRVEGDVYAVAASKDRRIGNTATTATRTYVKGWFPHSPVFDRFDYLNNVPGADALFTAMGLQVGQVGLGGPLHRNYSRQDILSQKRTYYGETSLVAVKLNLRGGANPRFISLRQLVDPALVDSEGFVKVSDMTGLGTGALLGTALWPKNWTLPAIWPKFSHLPMPPTTANDWVYTPWYVYLRPYVFLNVDGRAMSTPELVRRVLQRQVPGDQGGADVSVDWVGWEAAVTPSFTWNLARWLVIAHPWLLPLRLPILPGGMSPLGVLELAIDAVTGRAGWEGTIQPGWNPEAAAWWQGDNQQASLDLRRLLSGRFGDYLKPAETAPPTGKAAYLAPPAEYARWSPVVGRGGQLLGYRSPTGDANLVPVFSPRTATLVDWRLVPDLPPTAEALLPPPGPAPNAPAPTTPTPPAPTTPTLRTPHLTAGEARMARLLAGEQAKPAPNAMISAPEGTTPMGTTSVDVVPATDGASTDVVLSPSTAHAAPPASAVLPSTPGGVPTAGQTRAASARALAQPTAIGTVLAAAAATRTLADAPTGGGDPAAAARLLGLLPRFRGDGAGAAAALERFVSDVSGSEVSLAPAAEPRKTLGASVFPVRDDDGSMVAVIKIFPNTTEFVAQLSALERERSPEFTRSHVPEPLAVGVAEFDGEIAGLLLSSLAPGRSVTDVLAVIGGATGTQRERAMESDAEPAVAAVAEALAERHTVPVGSGGPVGDSFLRSHIDRARQQADQIAASADLNTIWGGLDVDELRRLVEDAIVALMNDLSGSALVHGDAHIDNIFYDPRTGVTFIDSGNAHYAMNTRGEPIGAPERDIASFDASLAHRGVQLGLTPAEVAHLRQVFIEAYQDNGGARLHDGALVFFRMRALLSRLFDTGNRLSRLEAKQDAALDSGDDLRAELLVTMALLNDVLPRRDGRR